MNEHSEFSDVVPPRWAETVLRVLVRPVDGDIISGDLTEEYREMVPARGLFRARIWYCLQVLSFLRAHNMAATLAAAMPPGPLVYALAAAATEFAFLFFLPEYWRSGDGLIILFGSAALIASVARGMPVGADVVPACRSVFGYICFFWVVAGLTVTAAVVSPLPLVAAFLITVPLTGFQWARRTGRFWAGGALAFVTGTAIFVIGAVLAEALRLRHPPYPAYGIPPAAAMIAGAVGAMLGKSLATGTSDADALKLIRPG